MKGFVYVMSNAAFEDQCLKIGRSDRDPTIFRRQELDNTSVPEPFMVEYFAFVEDHHGVESLAHDLLDKFRVRSNREFFNCGLTVAIDAIREAAGGDLKYEELFGNDVSTHDTDLVSKTDNHPLTTLAKGYFGTSIERLMIDPSESTHRWEGLCEKCNTEFRVTVVENLASSSVAVCPKCFFENEIKPGEI